MRDAIVERLRGRPFAPFRIMLTSGQAYEITHPHRVAPDQSQLTFYFPRSDRWAMLRMNQIASIESIDAAA